MQVALGKGYVFPLEIKSNRMVSNVRKIREAAGWVERVRRRDVEGCEEPGPTGCLGGASRCTAARTPALRLGRGRWAG